MRRIMVLVLCLPFLILGQGVMAAPETAPQQAGAIPETIRTDQLHIFLVPVGDSVRVGEYHVLSNSGEEPYEGVETPSGQRVVGFSLPEGAANLQFDGPGLGERFVEEEGGFALIEPIPPGQATAGVNFSYDLPGSEGLTVQRRSETAVASVVVMVSSTSFQLESDSLQYQGTIETEMGQAFYYIGPSLEPGQPISFTLVAAAVAPTTVATAAVPATHAAPSGAGAGAWVLGTLALAASLVFAYYQWQPGNRRSMPDRAGPMVEEIARLDQAYEAGSVAADDYNQKRTALVARLRSRLERAPGP